ncbi:MAG: phosphoglycerate kinase [Acidobacteriota bacterium]
MRTIRDLALTSKRVFIRVDFNVPIEHGKITDDTRIRAALPTIKYALEQRATVILASHLGRPKGKPKPEFSLKPVAEHLASLLVRPVAFAPDCVGPQAAAVVESNRGGVILLENLRFHPEEEKNDPEFARQLASLCDVYVNDAFGAAHRAHASTEGIVQFVNDAAAGLLMAAEVEYLGKALKSPERPFVAIMGGAKVSDKLEVIQNLLGRVDALLIGGAMAYTFFKAKGLPVGKSLVEDELLDNARDLEARAKARGVALELPVDHVVAEKIAAGAPTATLATGDPAIGDRLGLDIGPKTVERYNKIIAGAKTVVWNGPMGVFEIDAFAAGTIGIAHAVAAVKGTTIVGGGDSVAAVTRAGVADRITHISTGGGASLEFLGGRTLPGVAALER